MPEITLLGWTHTIIAIVALFAGFYSLLVCKVIRTDQRAGQLYLICTFIAAVTALMIYQHGGFGPAHALAVLTLLALAAGLMVTKVSALARIAIYFQAFCFSSTLLFHMIPAITDGLLRLPVGDPILTNPEDPLLRLFYLSFVAIFFVGAFLQFRWLRKNNHANMV
ncbi:MAG: hypothetical protein AAF542_06775 [Pseudomonadota bacterium]